MAIQKTGRMPYLDALRALAAGLVFCGHFVSSYMPAYEVWWHEGHILFGISGKFSVALFCVLLGYFATAKKMEPKAVPSYVVKRYLQFAVPLLLVGAASAAEKYLRGTQSLGTLLVAIAEESFLFQHRALCPPAWCIQDFFIASVVIALLNNRKHSRWAILTAMGMFLVSRKIWVANCLLGCVAWWIHNEVPVSVKRKVFSPVGKLLLGLAAFVMIRRHEGYVTYLLDGVSGMILVLLLLNSPLLQKLFSWKPLAAVGGVSFEIYLLHCLIYPLPRGAVVWLLGGVCSEQTLFFVSLAVSGVVVWLSAKGFHWLLGTRLFRLPYKLFDSGYNV